MKGVEIPADILSKLRAICLDFPEVLEENAWTGTRWVVRKKNFAHVLMIVDARPPAYAKAAGTNGPAVVFTFRLSDKNQGALRFSRPPFFLPEWFPNIAGVILDDDADWDEIQKLVIESYCAVAPKKLSDLVDRLE